MFGATAHRYIFLFGIFSLGGAILFGEVPTSVSQFILVGNWLFEGKFVEKWNRVRLNTVFWILSALFFIHLLGLLYTQDISRGLNDLQIKIPLLLLPLIFFTTPFLNKKELRTLLFLFLAGIVLSSFWCLFYTYNHVLNDLRDTSRFISHIRFGLIISMGICCAVYFIINEKNNLYKMLFLLVAAYLFFYMLKTGLITGLVMSVVLSLLFLFYLIFKQDFKIKLIGILLITLSAAYIVFFISKEWKAHTYVDTSEKNKPFVKTLQGNLYSEVKKSKQTENGFYVAYNIQYDELDTVWHRRSKTYIYSKDAKGNALVWNLIRYLTGKGLTKDSAGVATLSKEDILNIENGHSNHKYVNASPFRKRLKEFFWEYQDYVDGNNPSGNTMLMRIEFWKTAIYILKNNFFIGVGTGDSQIAFNKAYEEMQSVLSKEWRLRSHNQFLAIGVSFGFVGLFVFFVYLFYPLFKLRKRLHSLYYLFFIIAFGSFLTEDTLETQAGVTFFAYFNTLFLWHSQTDEQTNKKV